MKLSSIYDRNFYFGEELFKYRYSYFLSLSELTVRFSLPTLLFIFLAMKLVVFIELQHYKGSRTILLIL